MVWYVDLSILVTCIVWANQGFRASFVPVVWFIILYGITRTLDIANAESNPPSIFNKYVLKWFSLVYLSFDSAVLLTLTRSSAC